MTQEIVKRLAAESLETNRRFFDAHSADVARVADVILEALRSGGKLLVFGNGGSAADAQHIAAELVNRLNRDHPPIAAIALTTDTSILTSVANDTSFEEVFERQVIALGRAGDVALAISTSGDSRNVVRAVQAAHKLGITTIGLTGKRGGRLKESVDISLVVESSSAQRIQETHITVGHILCELIEDAMYPPG